MLTAWNYWGGCESEKQFEKECIENIQSLSKMKALLCIKPQMYLKQLQIDIWHLILNYYTWKVQKHSSETPPSNSLESQT